MTIRVIGVLRRTVVGNWRFDNLCGRWLLGRLSRHQSPTTNFSWLQSARWSFSVNIVNSWVQTILYRQQRHAISAKKFAYVISLLHNLLDAGWWFSEAVEMHVWKLSVALKELKFDEIMSVLLIKICCWFMTSINPSSYGYMLDGGC